ncbi:hypothetical protein FHS19_001683 [Paenibacillus rhizosphaerae]|uniref:Uncharacterized protein n=1 Tax=Paenibacillus rhizosphaerae TaxID=297318 RepID=A0A839TNU1_9BACL|nr:hypothetical protein [Paenibacillus rhizosphaerae]
MPTCPFYGSNIEEREHRYHCRFCDLELLDNEIQQNGSRKQISLDEPTSLEAAELSTRDLLGKDSYFLTCLLQLVRQERTISYHDYLLFFKKARHQEGDSLDDDRNAGRRYEYWTRKPWILGSVVVPFRRGSQMLICNQ